ncbi:MAG TPA: MaoC family dehydratase N-terminal domain-containing protein [Deltaproteobacteria bacterium]|nr:MaoC family dehydratase N-terminal domain-containing protein [Deltaproteobacteria bacterium]HPR53732.1 MaoC family dehydratase N-terminal domain-containing protein [Deltaproteobacteria bacterium]HXK47598.1 MaoC family dehydratase N-terminal domain-containing protein [Deltaproteobacteria bacterium]
MADHSKVGKEYARVSWEVERGKIRELARAIGDPNPIYLDREAAIREGYQDTPAPPTFLTVPIFWSASLPPVIMDLGINFMMVLHGEEEYQYYREIYPGDVITASPRIASIEEKTSKSGRKMDMVTVELLYTNQRGEKVARERAVLVERK